MWIAGLGLLLAGVFLLVLGGIFFITIILIPLAIIAALIGIILLVIGVLAVLARGVLYVERHTTPVHVYEAFQTVKYCTRCGAPNPKEAVYCANCGKQFLE
jgi:membrane-bound ClpP family serine protease